VTALADFPALENITTPEDHMDALMTTFEAAWREKYMKGQAEHGGRLWRKSTLAFMGEEVLDFVSYFGVLAPQLKRVEELLHLARTAENILDARNYANKALNIMRVGNEEGRPEEEL